MKIHECEQYSLDWWRIRRGVPTASEFHNIVNDSVMEFQRVDQYDDFGLKIIIDSKGERVMNANGKPRQTTDTALGYVKATRLETSDEWDARLRVTPLGAGAESYINRLIGDIYSPDYGVMDDYKSEAMKAGTLGETEARANYAFIHDIVVQQVGFITTDDGKFGCSPDSLVQEDGGLELKCPLPHTHVAYLRDPSKLLADYKAQCHGCLWITGRKWWDLQSFCHGFPPVIIRVEPNDYTERLAKVMTDFRKRYDAVLSAIQALQPKETNEGPQSNAISY